MDKKIDRTSLRALDIDRIVMSFKSQLTHSTVPDYDLKRKNIVPIFLKFVEDGRYQKGISAIVGNKTSSTADNEAAPSVDSKAVEESSSSFTPADVLNELHFIHSLHSDKDFPDFIFEDVLHFEFDILQQYKILFSQAEELKSMIELRKNQIAGFLKSTDEKSNEHSKNVEFMTEIRSWEKEAEEKMTTASLISMAIQNSEKRFFWGMGLNKSFYHDLYRVGIQTDDRRKYINFGLMPVVKGREMMELKERDHSQYVNLFRQFITDYSITDKIKDTVNSNPLISDRSNIIEAAIALFNNQNYQPFVYLLVPQIEGLFRVYMNTLHVHERPEGRSTMTDVARKIKEKQDFWEYVYYEFDFPELRNIVAHGNIIHVGEEKAYDILMDCHWIVMKINDKERDYRQWVEWLGEVSNAGKSMAVPLLLDYFSQDFDGNKHLENLKWFLSGEYKEVIKAYGLEESSGAFLKLLRDEGLYKAIWNEEIPIKIDGGSISLRSPDEVEVIKTVSFNSKPGKYKMFVDMMQKRGYCSDDWYSGYCKFLEKVEEGTNGLIKAVSECS